MIKRIASIALMGLVLALGHVTPSGAQTLIDNTTLASALTGTGTPQSPFETRIALTSVTCTGCTFGAQTIIFVDREAMQVTGAYTSGTTNIPVMRGAFGTQPSPHTTAAKVFVGAPIRFHGMPGGDIRGGNPPFGACTRTTQSFLPWINIQNGEVWSCDVSAGGTPAQGVWIGTAVMSLTYNSVQLR